MKKKVFSKILLLAAIFLMVPCMTAFASQNNELIDKLVDKGILTEAEADSILAEKSDIPKWVKKIKLNGDIRLRHDSQWRDTGDEDYTRNRERVRLRLGLKAKTTETTEVGVRLASGGEVNSTNQSFDESTAGKDLYIDRAYVTWKPSDLIHITGGKQKNPMFTSSLVWDSDVNPEGLSESLNFGIAEGVDVFANLGQWFLEELNIKGSDSDPTLFAYQAGIKFKPSKKVSLELGGAYYDFTNLDLLTNDTFVKDSGDQMILDGNGNLVNEFKCVEVTAKLKLKKILPVPVSVFGSFVQNTDADIEKLAAADSSLEAYGDDDRDSGWQVGFSVGDKKKQGDWYFKYFYQELEDFAFPALFVDSDFHGGGTNNKGHYANVRYMLTDNIQAAATGFITERENESVHGQKDEDRLQVDLIFNF
jgi:opacity protein-like surface antigen